MHSNMIKAFYKAKEGKKIKETKDRRKEPRTLKDIMKANKTGKK